MIGNCPYCGDYAWNKEVTGTTVHCPVCGGEWKFRKLPLFVLSGCSGVGKTTTAQALLQRRPDFVVLDADYLYAIMKPEKKDEYFQWVEQMLNLAKDISQSGRPVLWVTAGCLDLFHQTYHSRFFSRIYCLALTCSEETLRSRMTQGRGIADESWIESSVKYNQYFQTHDRLDQMCFRTLDITGTTPEERAETVENWVRGLWTEE